jgi:predicted secreted Zn-dependent protease
MTGALAFAEPNVKVTERSYIVDATTTQGLIFQMSTRGPLGFWAFTRTNVAWRGQCEVTVKIRHTLPVHSRPDQMPPDVRSDWERMTTALRRHEEKHGQHAINAGREIEQAGCVGGIATLRKWRGPDRALDARTNHGRTEGVFLQ